MEFLSRKTPFMVVLPEPVQGEEPCLFAYRSFDDAEETAIGTPYGMLCLLGDHREVFMKKFLDGGLRECLSYFMQQGSDKRSPTCGNVDNIMSHYKPH